MLKVLIAEDDLFMADMLEEVLVDHGYEVCGIARTVDEAVAIGERHTPDLAILDVRLAEEGLGTDIAARLHRPGLGILYATSNAENVGQIGLTKADGDACLGKPYRPTDIIRALTIVQEIVRTGQASEPFPKGFRVLSPVSKSAAAQKPHGKTSGKEVERLLRQQAALARFGSFALGESNLDKVLTEAARVCAEGLDVPFSKVCRYRQEEDDLLVVAGVGWHEGVIGIASSRADESTPQGRAFITGKPVICSDLNKDASFVLPSFYAEHGIVATVDVVIKKKDGQPYGVLQVDNPVAHEYDQHDVNFLTGFANIVAEAVNNSKRTNLLQTTADRMKDMVADRDRLLASKNLALNEKNLLLAEKSRLLDEKNVFAEELQHRVRNNLQLVYGMLNKHLQTVSDGAGKEGISAIARRVMTLAQIYDHLLSSGLSRTIDFRGYLSSLCSSFEALEEQKHRNIKLTCHSESVLLDLDSVTSLGLVIAELISNSYLHAFPDGTGKIDVSLRAGEPGSPATITFADDGVGFSKKGDDKRRGLGLVRRLMQQVNGSAELVSDHGTIWTLKFPSLAIPPVTLPANSAA